MLPRQKEARLHRALWHIEQGGDLANVVPLDAGQYDDEPQLLRECIDRLPELSGALLRNDRLCSRRRWIDLDP